MDLILDLLLHIGLITCGIVAYLIFVRGMSGKRKGHYTRPGWNYPLKLLWARWTVRSWKNAVEKWPLVEELKSDLHSGIDCLTLRASAPDTTTLLLTLRKVIRPKPLAEVTVYLRKPDGTTYILPRHPDTIVGEWDSTTWSAGGLKFEILEPGQRMRIIYNGLLTCTNTNETQHACFNFIWISATTAVRHPEDWSEELAARSLASEPWRDDTWPHMIERWDDGGWSQFGCVQGRFTFYAPDGTDSVTSYLRARGMTERYWSPYAYEGFRRYVCLMVAGKDGTTVHLRAVSYRDVMTEAISGSVRFPNSSMEVITWSDLSMADFCENKDIPKNYIINVATKSRHFKLVLTIGKGGSLYSGVPYQSETYYRELHGGVDGSEACGVLELMYENSEHLEPAVPISSRRSLKYAAIEDVGESYCANFDEKGALCPQIVGGKGSSIALLASVQHKEGYKVPPGFCITTKALDKHIQENPSIKEAIKDIEASNIDYTEQNFKDKCNRAVRLFLTTSLQGDLRNEILSYLKELRGSQNEQNLKFAVRSSAVGEDGEALSAAGQNETVLGCSTDEQVLNAIVKCWSSMFAFTSAHYRRSNGQPCYVGGALVIQKLVEAKAAGVLFTRHPAAGDPTRLLITANYGLGESVVSGTVDPDTIIVSRAIDGSLSIKTVELGSKTQQVVSTESGTTNVEVSEKDRASVCLSETEILGLAQYGVRQEQLWGAPRDIEWAVVGDDIYLLQARPITSLERWSEEELLHEFDSPIMSEEDLTTFANTGEVLPKPLSPLGYDLVYEPLNIAMSQVVNNSPDSYSEKSLGLTHYRAVLIMYNSIYRRMPRTLNTTVRMMEMSVHGHDVADARIHEIALRRRPYTVFGELEGIWIMIRSSFKAKGDAKKVVKKVEAMDIDKIQGTNEEILDALVEASSYVSKCTEYHANTTTSSTASQIMAMSVLLEGATDFSSDHYRDLGIILGGGDALSAEVPQALRSLARAIHESPLAEQFLATPKEQGMDWLRTNLPDVHSQVEKFLKQHGHRAIMEFDLATVPWALDPAGLMELLKQMKVVSEEPEPSTKTVNEIVDSLVTPKKNITRYLLRWLIKWCRSAVEQREITKAYLMLSIHLMRIATRRLGKQLVRDWLLPHPDLVFYLTSRELRTYIHTRDPVLLRKAIQRRQYAQIWSRLTFDEILEGWPVPRAAAAISTRSAGASLKATPVYKGDVVARACVIVDLAEIGCLEPGDILITHCTDIGWSPYFPLISGIVTELGGLISHGAVIARECGLPCIVGATGATEMFKTGDTVRLSGDTGVLEKVQVTH